MDTAFFVVFGAALVMLSSAGLAALLALKASRASRRRRAAWASTGTGTLLALMFLGSALEEAGDGGWEATAMMALIFVTGTALAIPAAVVMSRLAERLHGLGDTFA